MILPILSKKTRNSNSLSFRNKKPFVNRYVYYIGSIIISFENPQTAIQAKIPFIFKTFPNKSGLHPDTLKYFIHNNTLQSK